MKTVNLCVSTQGIHGGKTQISDKGCATLYVTDRGQQRSDLNIFVDTFEGYGRTYKRRDNALIKITFKEKVLFEGNIEELVKKLS